MAHEHVDVLIIGAGISGIGMACHLTRDCPDKTYKILERRTGIGGTWDLFRYPGVRSDSDMFTFGYNFRPWSDTKILADGASIREYVQDTAAEYHVNENIDFGLKVVRASWSSTELRWTVEALREASGETEIFTAGFVVGGTGYYNYDNGFRPQFPGEESFGGQLIHPQHWPADLDYAGKNVVIIGSGATAVTLVPAMAPDVAHVTMLQRSPTYIVSLPARDKISGNLRRILPEAVVYKLARARNIGIQRAMYALARVRPEVIRGYVVKNAKKSLQGASDVANFTPKYDPWDQRLCVVPDGDLFKAIRGGKAEVVTDVIKSFTETGIELESGRHLDADIIVSATGLTVQMLGGATLEVDGEKVNINERLTYKGVLLEGVPNLGFVFGYINASWTLKADLAADYMCRVIKRMDDKGYTSVVANGTDSDRAEASIMGLLNSGYVKRGNSELPRQGTNGPWKVDHDYLCDTLTLRHSSIEDSVLSFGSEAPITKPRPRPRASA